MLGLHSDTIGAVCRQFAISRDAKRKCPKFRASRGPKRSLGWVPFVARAIKTDGATVIYLRRRFYFWKHREIEGRLRCGSFNQDARGRWYVSFQCEVAEDRATGNGKIGIDLGLKTLATCSDGSKVPALRHYRRYELALGTAQRSRRKNRVRAIHAKIKNARKHHLHVASARLARENSLIVVGNVNSSQLAKTKMAKSVLDAGWSSLRFMLRYKIAMRQAAYIEADERLTTQACSDCGSVSGPKGIAGLGIRDWECPDCGARHDRDVNSAKNILRLGLECQPPAEEIAA